MSNKPKPQANNLAESIFVAAIAIEVQARASVGRRLNQQTVDDMAALSLEASDRYGAAMQKAIEFKAMVDRNNESRMASFTMPKEPPR